MSKLHKDKSNVTSIVPKKGELKPFCSNKRVTVSSPFLEEIVEYELKQLAQLIIRAYIEEHGQ